MKRVIEKSDVGRMVTVWTTCGPSPVQGLVVEVGNCYVIRTGPDTQTRLALAAICRVDYPHAQKG